MIIAFISSTIPEDLVESDIIIKMHSGNSNGTGLTVDSVIRLYKIVTIPKGLMKRKLGAVNKTIALETKNKISQLFED